LAILTFTAKLIGTSEEPSPQTGLIATYN